MKLPIIQQLTEHAFVEIQLPMRLPIQCSRAISLFTKPSFSSDIVDSDNCVVARIYSMTEEGANSLAKMFCDSANALKTDKYTLHLDDCIGVMLETGARGSDGDIC